MITVNEIFGSMITELMIIKELYELRIEEGRTNDCIQIIIRELSRQVLSQFLSLTDWNPKYKDNLTVNKNDYTKEELAKIEKERQKYQRFRNKHIAHITTSEDSVSASLDDLIRLTSMIMKTNVVLYSSGRIKDAFRPFLTNPVQKENT